MLADRAIRDAEDWQRVQGAMSTMGFSDTEKHDVLSMLAAILHLGNLTFTQNGGAQVRLGVQIHTSLLTVCFCLPPDW